MIYRRLSVSAANIFFFIFVVLFLGFQLLIGFIDNLMGLQLVDGNMYGMLLINEYLLILLPVVVFAVVKRLNFKEVFRLKGFGIIPALIIIAVSLPAYFVASMLNTFVVYLLQFLGTIPASEIPSPQNIRELIVGIFVISFSPALCEEMLNRGIMLKAYENRGSIKAVVLSAILFGIFHFDITNLLGPIFLGLLIGYYVIRTNSIFAGMLAHFINNSIAELLSYFLRDSGSDNVNVTISSIELATSVIYGVVGLIGVGMLIKLFNLATQENLRIKPSISSVRNDIVSIATHWPIVMVLIIYVIIAAFYLIFLVAQGG